MGDTLTIGEHDPHQLGAGIDLATMTMVSHNFCISF